MVLYYVSFIRCQKFSKVLLCVSDFFSRWPSDTRSSTCVCVRENVCVSVYVCVCVCVQISEAAKNTVPEKKSCVFLKWALYLRIRALILYTYLCGKSPHNQLCMTTMRTYIHIYMCVRVCVYVCVCVCVCVCKSC